MVTKLGFLGSSPVSLQAILQGKVQLGWGADKCLDEADLDAQAAGELFEAAGARVDVLPVAPGVEGD